MIKLNLGSGTLPLDGYENLDRADGKEAYPLVAYADNSVDEIRASHILEHFPMGKVMDVLIHWVSKLKDGGILKLAVPDFGKLCKAYVGREKMNYAGYILGDQQDENSFHKAIFDEVGLRDAFKKIGLNDIRTWKSEIEDCASYPISLNLQGTKKVIQKDDGNCIAAQGTILVKELASKGRNVYSQNGEDGILEAIFEKIGTENKWCLEVGAADGILFSNTRRLVELGWNAILIERDPQIYDRLSDNCKKYPNAQTYLFPIDSTTTLDTVLANDKAPKDIDLVVIDVDGQDWHIWNQMINYRPRVLVVEYDPDAKDPEFIPTLGASGQAGLDAIRRLASSKGYHHIVVTEYNVIAIRDEVVFRLLAESETPDIKVKKGEVKICAVMSMPRLAFSDNMFSSIRALIPLGINLEKGSGVFWGQVLTRLIELHMNDGTEYIITIDYDTYFTKKQVMKLVQLMQEHPEADAIMPLQIKRECDYPLIGKFDEEKKPITMLSSEEFKRDIMPMSTGHFGLTVFRVSSLKKLKKPWFIPHPDANGGWDEGRKDEDIHFWYNFADSGLNAFLAPQVGILHLQMMATAPGKLEDAFKPQHLYITDVEKNGLPEWCEPKVEMLK